MNVRRTIAVAAVALLVVLLGAIYFALKQGAPSGPPWKAEATPPDADTARVKESRPPDKWVVFKKTPQGELKLYAYLPGDWKSADKRPAIVFFFGGGWFKGSAQRFFSKAEYFASRGMVAFSAEYRLRDIHKITLDKCVEDARSAMRFVRKNAADWGVDPDRIVSSGASSGGHLAMAVAMLDGPDDPADDLKVSCNSQAMVLFNPVVEISKGDLIKVDPNHGQGRTPDDLRREAAALSPIRFLKKGSPPAILFLGENDDLMSSSQLFVERSTAMGNRAALWIAKDVGHGFFNDTPWHELTLTKADEFLTSLGYLKGKPTIQLVGDKEVLDKYAPATPPESE